MTDPAHAAAPDPPTRAGSRRGGSRPGAGRKPGYRKATITRLHLIRQMVAFDAHAAVFSGMTPLEMMQFCSWRLMGEGRWFEAAMVASRIAPYHHHRKPVTSISVVGDAVPKPDPDPTPPSGCGGTGGNPVPPKIRSHRLTGLPDGLPPDPAPPLAADPPMPPIDDERLSERRTGTEPKNLPSNAAVQVLLTPEAVTMLVPSLRDELVDPRNPYAHWGDAALMHNHLMNRRVWQHAERDRLREEREAAFCARWQALQDGTEPPPMPPAPGRRKRPSRSKTDQSEQLWERWRTHPLTVQARELGMLDEYDRPYEQAVYFKTLPPLELDES